MTPYETYLRENKEIKTETFNFFSEVNDFIYNSGVRRMALSVNLDYLDRYSLEYYEY